MDRARLALDVAGGDFGASVLIRGVLEAFRLRPDAFTARLCGDAQRVKDALAQEGVSPREYGDRITIEHCPQTISADDTPSRVWKNKQGAAIVRCIALQKEGRADASISAGDSGVLMSTAIFVLGRLEGVSRPALAAFMPTTGKHPVLLLDVGANLDCRPEHLVCFAMMGAGYIGPFCERETPRVALLNVGHEPSKGTKVVYEADRVLRRQYRGYRGFVEGSGVLAGEADVIVCDGFVGNVLLKASESFHTLTRKVLQNQPELLESIEEHMSILNAENYGAAPLLGIDGVVLKAHGSSSPKAITNAIMKAITALENKDTFRQTLVDRKGYQSTYAA